MDFNNGNACSVTLNLSHCTASNNATSATLGGSYSNTLTADSGYVFVRAGLLGGVQYGSDSDDKTGIICTVTNGGVNVTNSVFDVSSGEIDIDEVEGDIVVTVVEQNIPTN